MLSKYLIIAAAVAGLGLGSAGTLWISKAIKPEIKLSCPACPKQEPCNGIDFDKIKSRALTIQNHQHLTVNADSAFDSTIRKIIQEEISRTKLSRCK